MLRESGPARWLHVLLALAIPVSVSAQPTRLGAEFQVNAYTLDQQADASVAIEADGDFIVVWTSGVGGQDGSNAGVFAQRFTSAGARIGIEFQVNVFTPSTQSYGAVATRGDGAFVVVWRSANQDEGITGAGIFGELFDGVASGEFQINSYTLDIQSAPAIATDAAGNFVVAWNSKLQDGSGYGVFARRFSSAGAALGIEFQANTYTPGNQWFPAIAADADGDFVITWVSYGQDGSVSGVFARHFSSAGAALATEFQVSTYTSSYQSEPAVGADAGGDFVIAWSSFGQDGAFGGIFARRFSSAGSALATEFQVNVYTTSAEGAPTLAAEPDGDFVIAWDSYLQDGAKQGIFGRRFSSAGSPLGGEFQINSRTSGGQTHSSVVVGADGKFVVAWTSSDGQDGAFAGVFGQRFEPPVLAPLDIDGDGGSDPLTDGLLVLRYLFGFTGSTLTSGALDAQNCTRCDADAIAAHLDSIQSQLDIDGNGSLQPLTDGLLVLRYLFGFRGTTLVTGAVDLGGCTRCDAAAIEPYLAGVV
jgi:hypothetical protein